MRPEKLATAEWADLEEFGRSQAFEEGRKGMVWLGRMLDTGRPVGYADDRHICLVSGTRSGKGTTTIIPNLCLWPGSVVVVDPKGENATVTAARRGDGSEHCEGLGQIVRVLDPFRTAQVEEKYRATYNPLDALDASDPNVVDEAGRLADAIVVIPPGVSEPYWDEQARAMIKTLILHVLTSPRLDGRRDLLTVRDLLLRGDEEAFTKLTQMAAERGTKGPVDSQEALWHMARQNGALDGVVSGPASSFKTLAQSSKRTYYSVHAHAVQQTEFLDSPGMRKCLRSSSFDLSEIKTHPQGVSMYLSLPRRYMGEHFRWLRMMITLTVAEMESVPGQPVKGPVLFCLDEFAGLKRMSVLEDAVAQLAGFGVKLLFVLQTLEQLKAIYEDNWETFLANAGLKIVAGVDDHFTRQYISDYVGQTELIRITHNASEGDQVSEQIGISEGTSESLTEGTSWSRGKGGGTNWGETTGHTDSITYDQTLIGFRRTADVFRSVVGGRQVSNSSQFSRQSGGNESWNEGVGGNTSTQRGRSFSKSKSRSETNSQSKGWGQQIQQRPLVTPDEIGRTFARVDDPASPLFPGLAMVNITSRSACPVLKTNYYDDVFFVGKFDPHPDHGIPGSWDERPLLGEQEEELLKVFDVRSKDTRLIVKPGGSVQPEQPILDLGEHISPSTYQSLSAKLERGGFGFRHDDIPPREIPKELVTLAASARGFLEGSATASGAVIRHRGPFQLQAPREHLLFREKVSDPSWAWRQARSEYFDKWRAPIKLQSQVYAIMAALLAFGAFMAFRQDLGLLYVVVGAVAAAALGEQWWRMERRIQRIDSHESSRN